MPARPYRRLPNRRKTKPKQQAVCPERFQTACLFFGYNKRNFDRSQIVLNL